MYDTDYNIELACLKVLEAGDTGDTGDSWATVEKPQKKVEREEKPLVSSHFIPTLSIPITLNLKREKLLVS